MKARQSDLPKLTPAQWALLGRMVTHNMAVRSGIHQSNRSGTEARVDRVSTSSYGMGQRKVRWTVIERLSDEGLISYAEVRRDPAKHDWFYDHRVWTITREGRAAWEIKADSHSERKSICLGCGENSYHAPEDVCKECRLLMADGLKYRDSEEIEFADDVHVIAGRPKFPHSLYRGRDQEDVGKQLAEHFRAVTAMVSTPCSDPNPSSFSRRVMGEDDTERGLIEEFRIFSAMESSHHATMVPELAYGLSRLFLTMVKAIEVAHQNGHKDGRCVITELADGRTTLDEYQDRAAREEGS